MLHSVVKYTYICEGFGIAGVGGGSGWFSVDGNLLDWHYNIWIAQSATVDKVVVKIKHFSKISFVSQFNYVTRINFFLTNLKLNIHQNRFSLIILLAELATWNSKIKFYRVFFFSATICI